jgi:hypothetical protein
MCVCFALLLWLFGIAPFFLSGYWSPLIEVYLGVLQK